MTILCLPTVAKSMGHGGNLRRILSSENSAFLLPETERKMSLPIVAKEQESNRLPFVVNVVCQYWGVEIPISNHSVPGPSGPSMIDGIELAEAHGLKAFVYRGSVSDLKRRIDQSIPAIVILPGMLTVLQHANIVSGYSSSERRIFLYVPEPDTMGAVPDDSFDKQWMQDDRTTIVFVPSDMAGILSSEKLELAETNRQYLEAERLWRLGNVSEAEGKLRRALNREPSNVQAWAMLGSIINERGSTEAVSLYERAISINPRYFLAHRGLGNYYLKNKQYSKAASCYSAALEINPIRNPVIFKNRALAHIALNDNASARRDLQSYLEALPNAPDASAVREAIKDIGS